jgi:NAD(P)-dependent dehydrogenase (short-subunit alcohol dehydrogenase family)
MKPEKALVDELRTLGSEAEFINADVRKEDEVRALVDKTVARFGRLDVAVNNAGTEGEVGAGSPIRPLKRIQVRSTRTSSACAQHEARSARHATQGNAASSTSPRPTGMRAPREPPSRS